MWSLRLERHAHRLAVALVVVAMGAGVAEGGLGGVSDQEQPTFRPTGVFKFA